MDTYCYKAYGVPLSTGPDPNIFQFGGQAGYQTEVHSPGGTILCGARWYDPALGRWLSRDPIGYDGGADLYAYCGDNPVEGVDPDGLYVEVVFDPTHHRLTFRDTARPHSTMTIAAFSGGGQAFGSSLPPCVPSNRQNGTIPSGTYLIGAPAGAVSQLNGAQVVEWTLWGSNGKGGYAAGISVVKGPDGRNVTRNGISLHGGRLSYGCLTIPSQYDPTKPMPRLYHYPDSPGWSQLSGMLTRQDLKDKKNMYPYLPRGANPKTGTQHYRGVLIVK